MVFRFDWKRLAGLVLLASWGLAAPLSAQGKAPAWYGDLDRAYPDSQYMAAVGSGDKLRDAQADASAALARRFKVEIKVDAKAMQRYSDLVSKDQSYSATERSAMQTVTSTAAEQFINLSYSDPWTDPKGQVNVVAFLDREKTAALYKGIISKDAALVRSLKERAAKAGSLAAFALLDSAMAVSANSDRMLAQLQLIKAAAAAELSPLVDSPGLARLRDEAAARLGFRLNLAGDADGKVGAMVKKALAGFNLSFREDGQLNVEGTVTVEPEANTKYKTLRWSLNLSLVDETGTAIATMLKESRENGISDSAVRGFVVREMEKRIQIDFVATVNQYMARVATTK
jgi:hypothetical protein